MSDSAMPNAAMPHTAPHTAMPDALIARLAEDLRPVRRLAPPWRRAALWLAGALWAAAFMAMFADLPAIAQRQMAAPDMWLATTGAVLTGALACVAALATSVPGRSAWWAALPLPALALWVGASGAGCLRTAWGGGAMPFGQDPPVPCITFIVLVSVPLAAALLWLVLRACPLRPALTASLAGLASAGTAAALLTLIHPYDATAEDLAGHFVAVAVVVGVVRFLGVRVGRRAGAQVPLPPAPPS